MTSDSTLAERRVPRQVRDAAAAAAATPLDFSAQLFAAKLFLATVSQQRRSFEVLHQVWLVVVFHGHLPTLQRISRSDNDSTRDRNI